MAERLKVGAEFCGWDSLRAIYDAGKRARDKLLMLTLFKTGGRISEVLELTKNDIDLNVSEHSIVVRGMRVLKKFKHTKEGTESFDARRTFPVLKREPLSAEWIKLLEKWQSIRSKYLFSGQAWLTKHLRRGQAYDIVRRMGKESGFRVSAHWFRGQRASQLAEEYGFDVFSLNEYFGWGSRNPRSMAERYASLGWRGLEHRMLKNGI